MQYVTQVLSQKPCISFMQVP